MGSLVTKCSELLMRLVDIVAVIAIAFPIILSAATFVRFPNQAIRDPDGEYVALMTILPWIMIPTYVFSMVWIHVRYGKPIDRFYDKHPFFKTARFRLLFCVS